MQLTLKQSRIFRATNIVVKKEVNKINDDNFVITIDLQKPYKVISTIVCCLDAALLNGKKYGNI